MQTLNENSTKIEEEDQGEIPGRYEDFIGIYDNALSPEFCDAIIEAFDHYHRTNSVWCENDQFDNTIAVDLIGHLIYHISGQWWTCPNVV